MSTVNSKDGTIIAFDESGRGPAVIMIGGAMVQRAMDVSATQLPQHFRVFNYDRRGRGGSSDTQPFAVEREIEDIEALINEAGGSAFLFGISSGAALALQATLKLGSKVKKLAMYEVPYNDDPAAQQAWKDYRKQLNTLLAQGRNGDAVGLFLMFVGVPADEVEGMRGRPVWPTLEAVAPTLAYDAATLGEDASVPFEQASRVTVPTLVMNGSASPPFMYSTAVALAGAMPHGKHLTLEGQIHDVSAEAIAPVLVDFFTSDADVG
jgi:pimeloyl-ACP methyl ester carboxylesterase